MFIIYVAGLYRVANLELIPEVCCGAACVVCQCGQCVVAALGCHIIPGLATPVNPHNQHRMSSSLPPPSQASETPI